MKSRPSTRSPAPISPRGVLYLRDSGGEHEMTPTQYVRWAIKRSDELNVPFRGTPAEITRMIADGIPVSGDLFSDYRVKGNSLTRPALDVLRHEASERRVSHVFIPRRDRLARPENPLDGVELELSLLRAGVTVVLMNGIIEPPDNGRRFELGTLINMLIDYDRSGKDRLDLAEKMILAQIQLALLGYSTGGRAPYGFERWLIDPAGKPVRRLANGEKVRMPGHHVVWLPKFGSPELETALRIRRELLTKPASRIAKELSEEGVPAPDTGRTRTDNGVRHEVSGEWHVNTITAIGRNTLYAAVSRYGQRSMGDQLRFTREGPRPLTDEDRITKDRVKVVRNQQEKQITAKAHFEPLVSAEEDAALRTILDQRAGTQRGKPRSRDPNRNPLGCCTFDMTCGWPMYREPYSGSFRYVCGAYRHHKCGYHHVDGPRAVKFSVSLIRQCFASPTVRSVFQSTVTDLQNGRAIEQPDEAISQKEIALRSVQNDLAKVQANLARAKTDKQYDAISQEFDVLTMRSAELQAEVELLRQAALQSTRIDDDLVGRATLLLDKIIDLAEGADDFTVAKQLFLAVNLRLFFQFQKSPEPDDKKAQVLGGIATFGDSPPPIELYKGPTGRRGLKGIAQIDDCPRPSMVEEAEIQGIRGRKEKVLANMSRGDKTPIELFCRGLDQWDDVLHRELNALTS